MIPGPDAARARAQLMVWWILWASILLGLVLLYIFLGRGPVQAKDVLPEKSLTGLVGLVPLFLSIIIRWLVLPRSSGIKQALPMFIVGLASAEACGILGILLGGPYRQDLFLLGLLGIAQYVPFFAKNLLETKGSGFIPNN
jgi:hypothetical protein